MCRSNKTPCMLKIIFECMLFGSHTAIFSFKFFCNKKVIRQLETYGKPCLSCIKAQLYENVADCQITLLYHNLFWTLFLLQQIDLKKEFATTFFLRTKRNIAKKLEFICSSQYISKNGTTIFVCFTLTNILQSPHSYLLFIDTIINVLFYLISGVNYLFCFVCLHAVLILLIY